MLEARAAVVTGLGVDLRRRAGQRTCSSEQITVTRYGEPVRFWQSVQWQIDTLRDRCRPDRSPARNGIARRFPSASTAMGACTNKKSARRRRFIILQWLGSDRT